MSTEFKKLVETEEKIGIDTHSPRSLLSVAGGAAIGAKYAANDEAPKNGLLVEGNVGIGTNQPTAKLDVNGTIFGIGMVPPGAIIAWHPTEQHIDRGSDPITLKVPSGWAICDGENGTPDLRGQFLRGLPSDVHVADFLENTAKSAGQAEHDHGTHKHNLLDFTESPPNRHIPVNGNTKSSFTTDSPVPKACHLPPYVNVVYIMRLREEKKAGNPNRR